MDDEKKYITKYIEQHCILYPETHFFGKLSGTRYKAQYYLARALYNPEIMEKIVDIFYEIINENIGSFDFQITGRAWSSIPLLTAIPLLLRHKYNININSFMIKRERKTYGMHNYIEGIPNELPVMIVDDICNSTDSFRFCHQVLLSENLITFPYFFAVLNEYKKDIVPKALEEDRYLRNGYKPLTILNGDDINVSR